MGKVAEDPIIVIVERHVSIYLEQGIPRPPLLFTWFPLGSVLPQPELFQVREFSLPVRVVFNLHGDTLFSQLGMIFTMTYVQERSGVQFPC